jgi:DNA adenine methylase
MILNRLGNKTRIAKDIICHFPQHRTFIDMFFGAGGIYFNKPLAAHNFLNDIDDDVFNLYMVLQSDKDELVKQLALMPISESLMKHWYSNTELDPIRKALRFLMLSNFSYMGKMNTLRTSLNETKQDIERNIEACFLKLRYSNIICCDFRKVLKKVSFNQDGRNEEAKTFIYADPPYLDTDNNYSQGFKEQDTIDLFEILINSKIRFALSEFDNPFIIDLAKQHNLEVIVIGERQNMKNRRTEILVVNYESPALYSLFRNKEQSLLLV